MVCGNRSRVKGGQAGTFVDRLDADTGVPRDYLPAAMDDRVGWRKKPMGVAEIDQAVVIVVVYE